MNSLPAGNRSPLTYPRTGKRGVPQQFPRRLYEMLESESKKAASTADYQAIISWSESGKAFRIVDVPLFSTLILPKYFRTSKFSSFQRNLNLYGFSKVRRGPDTDMYAHPSFMRGCPATLSQLRKCRNPADRKKSTISPRLSRSDQPSASSDACGLGEGGISSNGSPHRARVVSPSPPKSQTHGLVVPPTQQRLSGQVDAGSDIHRGLNEYLRPTWAQQEAYGCASAILHRSVSPAQKCYNSIPFQCSNENAQITADLHAGAEILSRAGAGAGRLALLAIAMTSLADRD